MKLREAIKIYNKLQNDETIKKFEEARHMIIEQLDNQEPKRELYKSSNEYDYYIELPYKKLEFTSAGVKYIQYYYNAIGTGKGCKPTKYSLNFCRSLCKESKEEIIKTIEDHILEDNLKKYK